MKKLLMLGLILVLLSACIVIEEAEDEKPVEKVKEETPVQKLQPVKEVKEVEKVITVKKAEPKAYIAENLEIPTKYWYYNTDTDFGATVYGDKRASSWDDVSNRHTLCYWSPKSPEIYILYSEISEFGLMAVKNMSEDPTPGVKKDYLAYVRKEVSMKNYPESPVDWMIKFKNDIPVRIETSTEVLNVENRYITSNLKLHYKLNDEVYILKFDSHNKVPVVVERTRNGVVLERKKYYYDTQEYDLSTLRNADITPDRVEMPSDIVILSDAEAKEYEKMEYWRHPDDYNPLIVIDQVVKVFEGEYFRR